MILSDNQMDELINKGKRRLAESKAYLAYIKMTDNHRNKDRRPVEHFTSDQKPFVTAELIFLVTDPERPGLILSFSDEEACNHYCLTNECVYTSIPLYKI